MNRMKIKKKSKQNSVNKLVIYRSFLVEIVVLNKKKWILKLNFKEYQFHYFHGSIVHEIREI